MYLTAIICTVTVLIYSLHRIAGEYENRGFLKIMALGVPNAKSYAQPVTRLTIIKTNAETLHIKVLTFVNIL